MAKTLETLADTVHTFQLADGVELRASLTAVTDGETHYGVNVRQWIVTSSAERHGVSASNGRTRSDYTGPDGRHGLSLLQPSTALDLAEALARLAVEAERLERANERVEA